MSTCIINFNRIELQKQKSDTEHSDNDWMNIVWAVNGIPDRVDTFPLVNTAGSTVLKSGAVIPPFSRQLECPMGDLVMATYSIVNLGSTNDIRKQADAAAFIGRNIAQKVADIYLEVAQQVLNSGIGTLLGVPQALSSATAELVELFQKEIIKGIGLVFDDILVPILNDIIDIIGVVVGKPNCNGDVLQDTVSFTYSGTEGLNRHFTKTYKADHVSGCGSFAQTKADIFLSRIEDLSFGEPAKTAFVLYGILNNGNMQWYKHLGHDSGTPDWKTNNFPVGTGWQNFKHVFSGGGDIIYAVQTDGTLLWYKHRGSNDGSFNWIGPKTLTTGWNSFSHVFADGSGIIYAVTKEGNLLWYRHENYLTGEPGGWQGPKTVGYGWNMFSQVFSGGNGIIYGIVGPLFIKVEPLPDWAVREIGGLREFEISGDSRNETHPEKNVISVKHRFAHAGGEIEGDLFMYVHAGHARGDMNWFERKKIGTEWDVFTHVLSDGRNTIYGALGNDLPPYKKGDLIWYRNEISYKAGEIDTVQWDRKKVSTGGGWNDFKLLIGAIYLPPPVIH